MPRRPRHDAVDRFHHVMNRGIARRPMFENPQDMRFFLALLAREVRRGTLEIHAYSLMLNHYHLLVKSRTGQLSDAMQRIQGNYSRWFNRSRKRDGSLVRGRFLSKPIYDLAYRCNVLTYIHDNATKAGLVAEAGDYAWSSAAHWKNGKKPVWLATEWVQSELDARGTQRIEEVFPSRVDDDFRTWIERQLSKKLPEELEDATLQHVGSRRAVAWAIRKTRLADGTRPFHVISPAQAVERVVKATMRRVGPLLGYFKRKNRDAWTNLRAGVLRALSGCTQAEIGLRIHRHGSTVCRDLKEHRALLASIPDYDALHTAITHAVLESVRKASRLATT